MKKQRKLELHPMPILPNEIIQLILQITGNVGLYELLWQSSDKQVIAVFQKKRNLVVRNLMYLPNDAIYLDLATFNTIITESFLNRIMRAKFVEKKICYYCTFESNDFENTHYIVGKVATTDLIPEYEPEFDHFINFNYSVLTGVCHLIDLLRQCNISSNDSKLDYENYLACVNDVIFQNMLVINQFNTFFDEALGGITRLQPYVVVNGTNFNIYICNIKQNDCVLYGFGKSNIQRGTFLNLKLVHLSSLGHTASIHKLLSLLQIVEKYISALKKVFELMENLRTLLTQDHIDESNIMSQSTYDLSIQRAKAYKAYLIENGYVS